ncbi:MAG: GNAT family N-acetyltransferase [Firmicutes bacterium]|nr:GNAT family N-acetyltransferase [Bacillota bacterium]
MGVLQFNNVQIFADTASQLYSVFFKKYPALKVIVFNVILHSSGNFALSVIENKKTICNYTIYTSSKGNVIKEGIDEDVDVSFNIQKSLMDDILVNKDKYLNKPYKLLKFLPSFLSSVSIRKEKNEKEFLIGDKIILRPGREKDIFYLINWYNDKELNKLAGWIEGKMSIYSLKQSLKKSFGYDPMNLMIDTKGGKPIGTIQLYSFDELNQSCKLGIRIGDKDYWGKGYGEDAINTILRYAFYNLDIYRVSLKYYEYNERASNCYLKCGFEHEGRTRKSAFIDGEFYDEIIMGILKSDFISNAKGS